MNVIEELKSEQVTLRALIEHLEFWDEREQKQSKPWSGVSTDNMVGKVIRNLKSVERDCVVFPKKNLEELAANLFDLRVKCFKNIDLFRKFGGQLDMIDLLLFDKKLLTYGTSTLEADDELKKRLLGQNISDDKDKKTISE